MVYVPQNLSTKSAPSAFSTFDALNNQNIGFPGQGGKRVELLSDDDSINDACSIASGQSDNRSVLEDLTDNVEIDEVTQQEAFEEKLKEAIDGLTQKSAKGRVLCFHGVEKIFAAKYVPEFVEDRKMTIADSVEKGLKKGRGDEQSSAARLSTLLCVQLGMYDSAETVCRDLKSSLTFIANDNTASVAGRTEVHNFMIYFRHEFLKNSISCGFCNF